MKRNRLLTVLLAVFILLSTSATVYALDYGDVDPNRLPPDGFKDITWDDPGGWTTIDVTANGLPANDSSVNASVKVQDIINATSGRRILYFPDGDYYFNSSLFITEGDIRLKGNGKSNTTFNLVAPESNTLKIVFDGDTSGAPIAVSSSLTAGSTSVTVSDASTIGVGDFIRLYASNWIIDGISDNVGQIFKVNSKSGNVLTLDMALGIDIPSDKLPVVQKLNMLSNVGIEDLKVYRAQNNAEPSPNLKMNYVYNGRVVNIESSYTSDSHITAQYSKKIVVENNDIHDGYTFTGGQSYGIGFSNSTTSARASNNKLWNLRHHLVLSMGANHCVFSYNSLEPEIYGSGGHDAVAIHGRYAHNNLFEGNYTAYKMEADLAHDMNGPRNTFFRNYALENVGNVDPDTPQTNIVGNKLGSIGNSGSDNYVGANKNDSTILWGVFSPNPNLPASLYTSTKPSFLGSKPWPIFGPGVDSNWGTGNTLPAKDRSRTGEPIPPTTLLSDDFEDGDASGWTVESGTWSVVTDGSKVYKQSSSSGTGRSNAGSTSWTDYSVEAKIKPLSLGTGGSVGINFRYQDDNDNYVANLTNGEIKIKKKVAGANTELASKPYTITNGTTYTVKVVANGSTLELWINGVKELTATDTSFTSGKIAIQTYLSTAEFDDVVVAQ